MNMILTTITKEKARIEYMLSKYCKEYECLPKGSISEKRVGEKTYYYLKYRTGKQVAELFSQYQVWDYIYSCFEALHTTGVNYIVEDIDLYIEARQVSLV